MKTQIFGFLAAYATMAATQRNIKKSLRRCSLCVLCVKQLPETATRESLATPATSSYFQNPVYAMHKIVPLQIGDYA